MLTSKEIIQELLNNGYESYYIGGCVRDKLLGIPFTDEDIVTNAKSDEIDHIFQGKATIKHIGKLFGVVQIDGFEVATYRSDTYNNNELIIGNVSSLKEDCIRRDFTINALAMDIYGKIYDNSDGINDLNNKIIRANGDPYIRFCEDPSRILRAIYLSVKLNFLIEDKTLDIIKTHGKLIDKIEPNVVGRILTKVFKHELFYKFVSRLIEYDLLEFVFKIEKIKYIDCMENTTDEYILYALLFTGINYDYGMIEKILLPYLVQKKDIAIINAIVQHTDTCIKSNSIHKEIIKLMKNRESLDNLIDKMTNYYSLLYPSCDLACFKKKYYDKIYYPLELPINGNELIELGFTGKFIGVLLEKLVENNCKNIEICYEYLHPFRYQLVHIFRVQQQI